MTSCRVGAGRVVQVGGVTGVSVGLAVGVVRESSGIISSSSGGDGMLIIYARTGVAGVEKLAQSEERGERDAGFGS